MSILSSTHNSTTAALNAADRQGWELIVDADDCIQVAKNGTRAQMLMERPGEFVWMRLP